MVRFAADSITIVCSPHNQYQATKCIQATEWGQLNMFKKRECINKHSNFIYNSNWNYMYKHIQIYKMIIIILYNVKTVTILTYKHVKNIYLIRLRRYMTSLRLSISDVTGRPFLRRHLTSIHRRLFRQRSDVEQHDV